MIRTVSYALLAAALATPALAAEEATAPAAAPAATESTDIKGYTKQLDKSAQATQVRNLLAAQGYTGIGDLTVDSNGRWTGSATKDGKAVAVAVTLPSKVEATPSTN